MQDRRNPSEVDRVLAAAERLELAIPSLQKDIDHLKRFGEGNRRRIKWVAVAGAILTLLFFAFVVAYERADNAFDKAVSNSEYLQSSCEQGNISRAEEKSLWDTILLEDAKLSEDQGYVPSKEEEAALQRIEDKVNKLYAQRDCTKVDEGQLGIPSPGPAS